MTKLKPGALAALMTYKSIDDGSGRVLVSGEALDSAIDALTIKDEVFDEDLDEAIQDAVADGEGRATPHYLKTHLAARGLVIVPMGAPSDIAVSIEREACASIAEAIDSGRGNEKLIAKSIRERSDLRDLPTNSVAHSPAVRDEAEADKEFYIWLQSHGGVVLADQQQCFAAGYAAALSAAPVEPELISGAQMDAIEAAAIAGEPLTSLSASVGEPVARVSNDRCRLDDDPAPVASVTQVCACSETCAADGFTPVQKPSGAATRYDALGRRMEPVAMPNAQKDALARCYGRLWLVHTDNKSIHLARRELLSWLTKDEQAWGIEHAKAEALAWPPRATPPATSTGVVQRQRLIEWAQSKDPANIGRKTGEQWADEIISLTSRAELK